MKTSRLILTALLAASLASCASFTLVNANFDAASFIQPAQKTGAVSVAPATQTVLVVPKDDSSEANGYLVNGLPTLGFVERFRLQVKVGLTSTAASAGSVSGSLDVYLAPTGEQNVLQPQYLISSGTPVSLAPGASAPLELSVNLDKTATGAQGAALTEVKKGSFRFAARAKFDSTAGANIEYTVDTATLTVSGYPANALARQP